MKSEQRVGLLMAVVLLLAGHTSGESLVKQVQHEIHGVLPDLTAAVIPSSMASEIFFQIITYYAPVDAETPRCRNDSGKYVEAALRSDIWALQMFDASSKIEAGAIEGNIQGLGSYDECLAIDAPENFIGQHCMVELLWKSGPIMEKLKPNENETLLPVQPLNPMLSVCVPSTCSYQDVQTHMNVALHQLNVTTKLTPRSCSTRYPEPWETKDYVAMYVIVSLVGAVLLSTLYDCFFYSDSQVKSTGFLSSFSLYRNVPKLSTKGDPSELSSINGLRFIAIVWIVIGHRYIVGFSVPNFGLAKPEAYLQLWTMAPVHSVMLAVEIFLVLSGLLVAYTFLKSMEESKAFNLPKFYFHRYIRITPVYAVMILIDGILLYHLSDGPVWKFLTGAHRDICNENWWPGLLYISNYYYNKSFRACVAQTWYLSTDMQLYLLSPLLLIPLHKRPKLGLSLIFACFMATVSASFINASYYDLKAGSLVTANRKSDRNFELEYNKTHLRSASYFMGLALGYFVHKYKQGFLKVNFSKITTTACWIISTIILLGVIFSITIFQNIDYKAPQFVDSLYIALYRPMFSVGLIWVIFAGITGYGGIVNKTLSAPILRPLATLTYGIYMTHLTFQTLEVSRTRVPVDYTPFDLMIKCLADIVASIAVAVVLFLVVEAPFVEIDKWLFSKGGEVKQEKEDLPALPLHTADKTHL